MSHRMARCSASGSPWESSGPLLVVDEIANDLLDGLFAEVAVHLQSADDLAVLESTVFVAVSAQGRTRQFRVSRWRRERLEAFHHL